MCGIAGFLGRGSREDLERMTEALRHRGPDAGGLEVLAGQGVFLGHRRLSIIDLAAPPQPMWDTGRRACIVFNGEIYNHLELRRELEAEGFAFATRTDTEVLLCAWLRWGEACLERLNGMFAFAIHDAARKVLYLARDRFGKKPLYHASTPGGFLFASELTSLLRHPGCPRRVDPESVAAYMAFNSVPAPGCILAGVRKLEPGSSLLVDERDHSVTPARWYRFRVSPDEALTEAGALAAFDDLYGKAVQRRLMSDVPLGVFLSGGLDSTAVVLALARQGVRPLCFSVGFDDPSFDESAYAREVAGHFGCPHRVKMLTTAEVEGSIGRALASLDEPMGDASIVPTFLLCEFARREVTVALGGDGSDELLAGYDPFLALGPTRLGAPLLRRRAARAALLWLAGLLPTRHGNMTPEFRLRRWLRAFAHPEAAWAGAWMSALDEEAFARALPGLPSLPSLLLERALRTSGGPRPARLGEAMVHYYVDTYLSDSIHCKVDRASMRVSLEARAPFMDRDLAGLLAALPWRLRRRFPRGKVLLRRWLAGRVPETVLRRPKKGFGMPVARWLLGPLRPMMEEALAPAFLEEMHLDPAAVAAIWAQHAGMREDQRAFLWNLLVLRDWKRRALGS